MGNKLHVHVHVQYMYILTLKVLVATIDAQWEGIRDVGSARYQYCVQVSDKLLIPCCLCSLFCSISSC